MAMALTGRSRRGAGGTVLAVSGAPSAELNAIVSPALEPDPEEIASLADTENWDVPWSMHVRAVPGALVAGVAARHGLTEFTQVPLMVRRAELGLPERPAIDSLRVRAVAADELGLYIAALEQGFEAPQGMLQVLADPSLAKIDGLAFYLAEVDGVPVGTGMTAISDGLTAISNITTLAPYRRRGYGRAVTGEMIRAGFAAGAPTAFLYSSEMGRPVYESLGFRTGEYRTVITAPS